MSIVGIFEMRAKINIILKDCHFLINFMFLFQLSFCFCFRKTNKEFALKIISKAKVKGKVSLISR